MTHERNLTLEDCNISGDERELFTGFRDYLHLLEGNCTYPSAFRCEIVDFMKGMVRDFLMSRGVSWDDAYDFAWNRHFPRNVDKAGSGLAIQHLSYSIGMMQACQ